MRKYSVLVAVLAVSVLSGCYATEGQRALGGAAAGALIADATDTNVVAGAAIGALAGTYCDDMGVCQ
ncbi:hypothetical protein OE699_03435 [Sedimentimonas flavescens]|uniref:Glycine zipper 2TM domain-containing protein n=1 Tax=Sedimentimonas flavescens TaxID=2851012 RepID=A0ABT2ZVW7_9RHOB|nr:hypothetical protein [Sedimentimonas flavescens]MBW0157448.1 hypothetical protein [Sedimentimonas flavescens]MCT2538718.1 hypothetical protein [Sedimentimonas flavescens]MCV2877895.1 hypothetical protein [Sedimentimonas flavescens]WBL34238.1 hypothetical protein O5O51_05915 [Sinirhodobacter sp. HNIBRBA609]